MIAERLSHAEEWPIQQGSDLCRYPALFKRLAHAHHPRITLCLSDGKRSVRGDDAFVVGSLEIERRASKPPAQEFEETLPHGGKIGRVHRPASRGLGCAVHDVVKAIYDLSNHRFPANHLVRRWCDALGGIFKGHCVSSSKFLLAAC